jgi:hypothetical protein
VNPIPKLVAIIITGLFFWGSIPSTIYAQLSLPLIFGEGMVLQREHVIPIWGKASAKTEVTVSLAGFTQSANSDEHGNWYVELPAMNAGGSYIMKVSADSQQIIRTDIYVGDVWVASGQSNMEFPVCALEGAESIISSANDQKIHQFKIKKELSDTLSDEFPTGSAWTSAVPRYVWEYTAVGYYFAYYLRQNIDIPIGIINVSYSGSRIEAWMSYEMLGYHKADPKIVGTEPQHQPSVIFNKMLFPLIKFPIKGILWYQGESNTNNILDSKTYSHLFKTMIKGWRGLWNDGDIPFLWVQLPGYGNVYDQPQTLKSWPYLRAAQSSALSLPNTAEAIAIDLGSVDVHPKNKRDVGYRLSLIAREKVYNENIVGSSPRYVRNYLRDDGKIIIDFQNIVAGLKARDTKDNEVNGFAVGDKDNKMAWANAIIENDKVVVWSDEIPNPEIVRYAWENNPATANLYNSENLPAAPFLAKVDHGVKIKYFKIGNDVRQIGGTTTLSWLVQGASAVFLNGIQVDTSSTIKIQFGRTNLFELIAEDKYVASKRDTSLISFVIPSSELLLEQNYPNPCNPKTTISYLLPHDGIVQIKIFDALGREVKTLLDTFLEAGEHSIDWDGSSSASGIYFCSLTFKGRTLFKKMLLLK